MRLDAVAAVATLAAVVAGATTFSNDEVYLRSHEVSQAIPVDEMALRRRTVEPSTSVPSSLDSALADSLARAAQLLTSSPGSVDDVNQAEGATQDTPVPASLLPSSTTVEDSLPSAAPTSTTSDPNPSPTESSTQKPRLSTTRPKLRPNMTALNTTNTTEPQITFPISNTTVAGLLPPPLSSSPASAEPTAVATPIEASPRPSMTNSTPYPIATTTQVTITFPPTTSTVPPEPSQTPPATTAQNSSQPTATPSLTSEPSPTPTALQSTSALPTPSPTSGDTSSPSTSPSPAPTVRDNATPLPTDIIVVTQPPRVTVSDTTADLLNGPRRPPSSTSSVDGLFTASSPTPPASTSNQPLPIVTPRVASANTQSSDDDALDDASVISVVGVDSVESIRYVFSAVVGVTCVFLVYFHYMALNPALASAPPTAATLTLWELPLFVSFLQSVAVLSLANIDAPFVGLVKFTDALSWANLILPGGAFSRTPSADSPLAPLGNSTHRRLLAAPDASQPLDSAAALPGPFGIQQFALRIHVHESALFHNAWTLFLVVLAVGIVLTLATRLLARTAVCSRGRQATNDETQYSNTIQQGSRRCLGLLVWLVTAAVLPLTAVSAYELIQVKSSGGSIHMVLPAMALGAVAGVIVGGAVFMQRQSTASLSKFHTKVTFGALYVHCTFKWRSFFALGRVAHAAIGLLLAWATTPSTQLLALVAVQCVYVVAMVVLRPFVGKLELVVSASLHAIVAAIYGLAYAMTQTSDASAKTQLGCGIVGLVCVVVAAVFVRCVVALAKFTKPPLVDTNDTSSTQALTGTPLFWPPPVEASNAATNDTALAYDVCASPDVPVALVDKNVKAAPPHPVK